MKELVRQSATVKWTCDGCGHTKEFEAINTPVGDLEEMCTWITVIREIARDGQVVGKYALVAHSPECVPIVVGKLFAPLPDEPADNIDLSQLQTDRERVN